MKTRKPKPFTYQVTPAQMGELRIALWQADNQIQESIAAIGAINRAVIKIEKLIDTITTAQKQP